MVPGSILLFFYCLTGGGSTCLHREFVRLRGLWWKIVGWSQRLLFRCPGPHQEDHLPLAKRQVNPRSSMRAIRLPLPEGVLGSSTNLVIQELVPSASVIGVVPPALTTILSSSTITSLSSLMPSQTSSASVRGIGLCSLSREWGSHPAPMEEVEWDHLLHLPS